MWSMLVLEQFVSGAGLVHPYSGDTTPSCEWLQFSLPGILEISGHQEIFGIS